MYGANRSGLSEIFLLSLLMLFITSGASLLFSEPVEAHSNGISMYTVVIDSGGDSLSWFRDWDGDGFGDPFVEVIKAAAPDGYVSNNTDCNDLLGAVFPGAEEICNGIDDNCSGTADENLPDEAVSIQWHKFYGGTANDYGQSMTRTPDGNIVLAGYSQSTNGDVTGNHGDYDVWLAKVNSEGNMLWQKTFGGSLKDVANMIRPTVDSGFIVIGYTTSTNGDVSGLHGAEDMWVIKLDKDGDLQWQRTYGGNKSDIGFTVLPLPDGSYMLAGESYSANGDVTQNHGSGDYWVLHINSTGEIIWQKSYGGSLFDFAHALDRTADGCFIVSGYERSANGDVLLNKGQEDMWILKLDSMGNILWQKSYGGTAGDGAF